MQKPCFAMLLSIAMLATLLVLSASCKSADNNGKAVVTAAEQEEYERSVGTIEGGHEVSILVFKTDKELVLKKVEVLQDIMDRRDYKSWLDHIETESKEFWSDTANLTRYSKMLPMEFKDVKLRNLFHYFHYVFIPARRGHKIDEIRYTSPESIVAVQYPVLNARSDTVVYYNFVKEDGEWKIHLPRF